MITVGQGATNKQVFRRIKKTARLSEFGIRQAWFSVGKDLIAEAKRATIVKPRSGRTYVIVTKSGKKRRHKASLPGESHANMTGTLRKSLQWKVQGTELEFGYGIANGAAPKYAQWVEFGTKRMAARPTAQNSIRDNEENAVQHFNREIVKELNGG